jgi:hypothetical protein
LGWAWARQTLLREDAEVAELGRVFQRFWRGALGALAVQSSGLSLIRARSRGSAERYGESVVPLATRDTSTNWSMFGCRAISMRRFLALFFGLSLATTGSNSA